MPNESSEKDLQIKSKSSNPKAFQSLINICVNFAEKHGLVYNERNTKFMCMKPTALKNIYAPNVELNGKILELVKTKKYLGFIANDSFNDVPCLKRPLTKTASLEVLGDV